MNTIRLFEGVKHAADYVKFRPTAPVELLHRILEYLGQSAPPPYDIAADVGCGSGQSTHLLANHFRNIVGVDVSEAQIQEANKRPNKPANVQFKVGFSHQLPFEDESVDLVTVSQAFHWFDQEKFFAEANRILKKNGALAIYSYTFPELTFGTKSKQLLDLANNVYTVETAGYWHENRKLVDTEFAGLVLPFKDFLREDFTFKSDSTVLGYVGYVKTWSGMVDLNSKDPAKGAAIVEKLEKDILSVMEVPTSAADTKVELETKYVLFLGRK